MYTPLCDVKTGFRRCNKLPEDGRTKSKFECLSADLVLFPLDNAFVHTKTLFLIEKTLQQVTQEK